MNPIISNSIILIALALLIPFSVKSMIAHFRGESSCCGGGTKTTRIRKKKLEHVIAVKTIRIEGMVCDNCSVRVSNALNSIDGVSAKVVRSKNQAIVKMEKEIEEEVLKKAVTDLGYRVTEISQIR